jgi:hypothetical protein
MSITFQAGYFDWQGAVDNDGKFTSASVPWFCFGTDDEEEALAAAVDETPDEFNGLPRTSIEFADRINENACKLLVQYAGANGGGSTSDEAAESISFDTTGGTQHITQSLLTKGRYPTGGGSGDAPDLGGAIGYDGEQVNGVDIAMPNLSFSLSRIVAAREITTPFRLALAAITGKVNSAVWKGYAAGEIIFLGAAGGGRIDQPIEITYRFAHSQNRDSFTVGEISVPGKLGWEYMWVRYADKKDTGTNSIVRKPVAVYIEQVYETADFAALGLGR